MLPVLSPSTKLALGSLVDRGAGLTLSPPLYSHRKLQADRYNECSRTGLILTPGFISIIQVPDSCLWA